MDIPLLDSFKNRIDLSKVDFAAIKNTGTEKWQSFVCLIKTVDKKTLIQSLGVALGLYILIFLYVYIYASSTVKNLENKMASETTEVSQGVVFGQSKIDNKYYANNNLVDGLSKYEDIGRLPIIRASDQYTSFRAYQMPFVFDDHEKRTITAFMLKDYGLSNKNSELALDILPQEVSFLLSPYAAQPMEWIKRARSKGHEVWLDIPVQTKKYPDSGLNTIFHHQNLNEKYDSMYESLTRALGYVGVGMFLDKTITPVEDHYEQISDNLYGRGLGIFEKNPYAPAIIEATALTRGSPFIKADLEIIQMRGENSFASMEMVAKKQKYAVAVVPAYPVALKNLSNWIEKVGRIDYVVAPVSAIYDLPIARTSARKQTNTPSALSPSDHAAQPVKHQQKKQTHH